MAEKKVKVTFLETRIVQDGLEGSEDETRYDEGENYSLSEASANRWISRGVAVLTKDYLKHKKAKLAEENKQAKASKVSSPSDTTSEVVEGLRDQVDDLTTELVDVKEKAQKLLSGFNITTEQLEELWKAADEAEIEVGDQLIDQIVQVATDRKLAESASESKTAEKTAEKPADQTEETKPAKQEPQNVVSDKDIMPSDNQMFGEDEGSK